MRRTTLFLFIFLLCGLGKLAAQMDNIRFEVHFDPTINWVYSDTKRYKNQGAMGGFIAGLEMEWMFAKRYALLVGADVNYHQVSLWNDAELDRIPLKYEDAPAFTTEHTLVKPQSTMLNFPIGLKLRAVEIGYFTLYAAVGGMLQIPLSQRVTSPEAIPALRKEATKKYLQPVNAGIFGRLGVEYALGNRSAIEAGFGYYSILSPLLKVENGRITAGTFVFRVGFVF